jgi:hypothetical protein
MAVKVYHGKKILKFFDILRGASIDRGGVFDHGGKEGPVCVQYVCKARDRTCSIRGHCTVDNQ